MIFRNLLLLATLVLGCLCQHNHGNSGNNHHPHGPDKCVLCRTDHGRNHCEHEDSCGDDEVCYIQQFSTHSGYINHAGCIDHQKCSSIGTHSIYHDSFREDLTAGRCCYTYMCNTQQSLHTNTMTTKPTEKPTEKPTTTLEPVTSPNQLAHTSVDHCMKCVIERDIKYHCDHHETCQQGQVCFLQEFKFIFQTFYHGGCVEASKCDSVATASFHEDYPREHVIDGRCCSSNNCNKESIFNQPHPSHTQPPSGTHPTQSHTATTTTTTPEPTTTVAPVQECMQCHNDGSVGWQCDRTQTCGVNQACFVQELEFKNYLPGIPPTYFHGGCIDKSTCPTVGSQSVENENGLANLLRGECCHTTNCNKALKATYEAEFHTTTTPTTTTPTTTTTTTTTTMPTTTTTVAPVTQCLKCHDDGMVGWMCDQVDTCTVGQVCYAQQLEFNTYLPGIAPTYFHGGCIDKSECTKVRIQSLYDEHGLASLLRGECCDTTDCNKALKTTFEALFVPTTTPKPVTTTTTTEAPTTTKAVPKTTAATVTSPAPALQCTKCHSDGMVGWQCDRMETCQTGEVCYVQELKFSSAIPGLPPTYFHGGCIKQTRCTDIATKSVEDEHGLATIIRGECCSTPNCNKAKIDTFQGMPIEPFTTEEKTTTTEATTNPPRTTTTTPVPPTTTIDNIRSCMQCVLEYTSWNCSVVQKCANEDEVCYVQEMKMPFSIPPLPDVFNHAGCVAQAKCPTIDSVNHGDEGTMASVAKGDCCVGSMCNKVLLESYVAARQHTTTKPDQQPVTVTTKAPVTTTTTVQSTVKPVQCAVCSGQLCGLVPGGDPFQECPSSTPFCLNTVVNSADGTQTITKKCASGYTCNTQWWQETSDKTICTSFDSSTLYSTDFTCSYCCTEDRCNDDLFPAPNTLFHGSD